MAAASPRGEQEGCCGGRRPRTSCGSPPARAARAEVGRGGASLFSRRNGLPARGGSQRQNILSNWAGVSQSPGAPPRGGEAVMGGPDQVPQVNGRVDDPAQNLIQPGSGCCGFRCGSRRRRRSRPGMQSLASSSRCNPFGEPPRAAECDMRRDLRNKCQTR